MEPIHIFSYIYSLWNIFINFKWQVLRDSNPYERFGDRHADRYIKHLLNWHRPEESNPVPLVLEASM